MKERMEWVIEEVIVPLVDSGKDTAVNMDNHISRLLILPPQHRLEHLSSAFLPPSSISIPQLTLT